MFASQGCRLTDIVDPLRENSPKVNFVERLSRHLNREVSFRALKSYLSFIRKYVPEQFIILIDDSDIVKPDGHGYAFETLGIVRYDSKNTVAKSVFSKGHHVTADCVLTRSGYPLTIFSEIYSSKEKNFTSFNLGDVRVMDIMQEELTKRDRLNFLTKGISAMDLFIRVT